MRTVYHDLNGFFLEVLGDLNCRPDTRAYIVGIYSQYHNTIHDLSQYNLTLLFAQAQLNYDFYEHQKIADWIFFVNSLMPKHLDGSGDYYENMARLSYYSCYKLMNKRWPLFEELADRFIVLENEAREKLINILPK